MGKYYQTGDICEIIDNKLELIEKSTMGDENLNGDELLTRVKSYRILKECLYSLVDELKEEDVKYDAEMAAWRASQEEKKNGTDS